MRLPLIITACALTTACTATKPAFSPAARMPDTVLIQPQSGSVRLQERVKPYPVGRYIDPNNGQIMHESHTVYRVESPARWSLSGGDRCISTAPSNRAQGPKNSDTTCAKDELLMEVNRQKAVTRTVVQSSEAVSSKLAALAATLEETRKASGTSLELQQQLEEAKKRLERLEQESKEMRQTTRSANGHSTAEW